MSINDKPVFLKGHLHEIKEPAGITYFPANVIVAVTSTNKDSLLKEKALSVDEILKAMHEEGYTSLTSKNILGFVQKYDIVHYNFFLTLIRKLFKIAKKKSPEITIEKYYDAIGKESMNIIRHQALALIGEKFTLLGKNIKGTTFLQRLNITFNDFLLLFKGNIAKNPRFLYKNLEYYCVTMNCLKFVIHESEEDIENNRIGIEYIFQRDFDFYDEFNVWYSKTTLKWIPIGCGCSKLSEVEFTKKNGNPFFIVKYFPEKVSIKHFINFFVKKNIAYNAMSTEQIQKEKEINQKEELLKEYSYETFWIQSQLNNFLSEIPENERAIRINDIMRSILHDWDKHIKNIEYFGEKIEEGLKLLDSHIPTLNKFHGPSAIDNSSALSVINESPKGGQRGVDENISYFIKLANYITLEANNLSKSINEIRNYNKFINNFEIMNINKLIKTILDVEHYKIGKYKNDILFSPETENVSIRVNPYQINNMIRNLFDNAIKYGDVTHPEFYINLHVSRDGDYLKILIENTGGISKRTYEYLTNACEKRERFTTSEKGEGQGLKNVIEIINNHNGKYLIPYNEEKFIFIAYLPIVDFN